MADDQLRRMRRRSVDESARPRAHRRRWVASAAACVVSVLAAARLPQAPLVDAALMAAAYKDGVTYCWQVGASVYASAVNSSTAVAQATDADCALSLSMTLTNNSFFVGEAIQVTWQAALRRDSAGTFSTNKFGIEQLYTAQDRISQNAFEIVYSRLESCSGASDCNPVLGNTNQISNVPNKPLNFSSDGSASFSTDRVAFSSSGAVTLVAHLILPGQSADQLRFDFAVFKTISINDRPALSPTKSASSESQSQSSTSSDSKGLSTVVIGIMFVCGMVAVALVAVGFVILKKNKAAAAPDDPHQKGPDGRTRQDASSTDLDDEFAMLSNEERLMMSQNGRSKKSNGFLSTRSGAPSMLEESRAKAKGEAPLPFVGKTGSDRSDRSQDRVDLSSDEHMVDPSNPASMRHHGLYMEMPAPASIPKQSRINYNDIREDEVLGNSSSRRMGSRMQPGMSSSGNPFAASGGGNVGTVPSVAERLAGGGFDPPPAGEEWGMRVSTELTFDDLRESADLGPALTLDDLLESKQVRKKGTSRAIAEHSAM